jgi:Fur family ferric uptake transcriptional regulator
MATGDPSPEAGRIGRRPVVAKCGRLGHLTLPRKFRITRQRQVILEELRKVTTHPTADEVCQMVRRRMPRISLGTVYRNLEILSDYGLVQKLELAGSQRRFDGNTNPHYHVRCNGCNRVEDLPAQPISIPETAIQEMTDFEITGHRVEFYGLCPGCKKGNAQGNKMVL